MSGYLITNRKEECCGCEACAQVCPVKAIKMISDDEGFRYPHIDKAICMDCKLCERVCPESNVIEKNEEKQQFAWGGYHLDEEVRKKSTSGGAFTAVVEEWFQPGSYIYGAMEKLPLEIVHEHIEDVKDIDKFRRSKYLQSKIGSAYIEIKEKLKNGARVLFSGTPCQIAGLYAFLGTKDKYDNLLTVEVMCEGVPSPIYMQKYIQYIESKKKRKVRYIDWRYKNKNKWDFEFMKMDFEHGNEYKISRWFNPFWSIWLNHLISRPSCYKCSYATKNRIADITLADLWGVHIYCPELYGKNTGASLILCNSKKGKKLWDSAKKNMYGHSLKISEVIKYQSPMRNHIEVNEKREQCIRDIQSMDYKHICKKWANKPDIKLLFSKYVYGNRQKVFFWNLFNNIRNNL